MHSARGPTPRAELSWNRATSSADRGSHPGPVVTFIRGLQVRADTAPPYGFKVNLTEWLMSAPNAPVIPLTLEDLVQRPAWHQEAACRGQRDLLFVMWSTPMRRLQLCAG